MLEGSTATCRYCGAQGSGYTYRRRSPVVAAALGLLPGLGHLYLGHFGRGLGVLASFGALQFFGADLDLTAIGAAVGVPMELGGFGIWAWSIVDAYRLAQQQQRYAHVYDTAGGSQPT